MSTVKFHTDDSGIATITLDRDDARNAISNAMAAEILRLLGEAEASGARAIVLRANPGVSVWCAGHDLADLDPAALETENLTLKICRKIQASPLPVIAMVEGRVFGGGVLLLLCADMVVAAPSASVAFTAAKLGIPLEPHWYAFWLGVMGLHKTKEMLLTAAPLSAEDAHAAGLYNRLVTSEQLEPTVRAMAEQVAGCSAEAVANIKGTLNAIAGQLALSDEQRGGIERNNAHLLRSPDVKTRIAALLKSLQR